MQAKFVYAIRFVTDMDAALAYFRDTLGLSVRFATPFWSEFDTGGVTLALHPASDTNPAGQVRLGFSTEDLAGVYAARAATGVDFAEAPRPQHGSLISMIRDLEGVEISLSGGPA